MAHRHHLDDMAQLPHRLHHPRIVAVVVCVVVHVGVVGSQSWLLVVVAIGEMLVVVGTVVVNGGGWEGRIVDCLVILDDNKLSVGVCQHSLWA